MSSANGSRGKSSAGQRRRDDPSDYEDTQLKPRAPRPTPLRDDSGTPASSNRPKSALTWPAPEHRPRAAEHQSPYRPPVAQAAEPVARRASPRVEEPLEAGDTVGERVTEPLDAPLPRNPKLKKINVAKATVEVALKDATRSQQRDVEYRAQREPYAFDEDELPEDVVSRSRAKAYPYPPVPRYQALPLPRPEAPIYSLNPNLLMLFVGLFSVLIIFFLGPWQGATEFGNFVVQLRGSQSKSAFQAALMPSVPGDYNLKAAPSISAQHIDAILESYASPATGTGPIWYQLGLEFGIDPAFAVAFFIVESSAGTNPRWDGMKVYDANNPRNSQTTHNIGNISCAGYPTCMGRWRDYPDWETGIRDWYRLIDVEYIQGRGHKTVADVLPVYAPSFENDTNAYVNTVNGIVDTWRTQGMQP